MNTIHWNTKCKPLTCLCCCFVTYWYNPLQEAMETAIWEMRSPPGVRRVEVPTKSTNRLVTYNVGVRFEEDVDEPDAIGGTVWHELSSKKRVVIWGTLVQGRRQLNSPPDWSARCVYILLHENCSAPFHFLSRFVDRVVNMNLYDYSDCSSCFCSVPSWTGIILQYRNRTTRRSQRDFSEERPYPSPCTFSSFI